MINDRLTDWIRTKKLEFVNFTKDELANIFGKDFAAMKGYSQNNPHHCYDLLKHTNMTVTNLNLDDLNNVEATELIIAALYHDIGKPFVALEKNGRTVFYNHAVKSREIAEKILCDCNLDDCSLSRILFYIEHHDAFISFKLKDYIEDDKNPFILPITLEQVYKKIIDTQEICKKRHRYIPTIYDYELLMRLCIADAKAQKKIVIQEDVKIDSLDQKLERLKSILEKIRLIKTMDSEKCDLHTHSIYSDGTDTPQELLSKAVECGVSALALTDHNTIAGLDNFMEASKDFDIDAVPGVEFSTEYADHELHIIALFVKKVSYKRIEKYLKFSCMAKEESNRELIQNLYNDGFDVKYEELEAFAKTGNINRAVIAQYLLSKGIISSVKEGFKTILSKDSRYYSPPKRPSSLETIRFINSIGAVAVLAHPLLDLTPNELESFIPIAKEYGLRVIEADYSLFSDDQRTYLREFAQNNDLSVSGGSDYHGTGKPHINLGNGKGDLVVPLTTYLSMIEKFQQ